MTTKTFVRLAEIAREHDLHGRAREADAVTDAMIRIAQESATGNWWNGVKQIGQGLADDSRALGNAVAAPFEGAAAAASAAWNQGLKNAPAAAGQAAGQAWDRAKDYTQQEFALYGQAAPALAGPGGTGLPGAMAQDAVTNVQNGIAGAGAAAQGVAQNYVGGLVNQQTDAQQQGSFPEWLHQALAAHKQNGTGWQVINNVIQYARLTPENATKLKQQFQQASASVIPTK